MVTLCAKKSLGKGKVFQSVLSLIERTEVFFIESAEPSVTFCDVHCVLWPGLFNRHFCTLERNKWQTAGEVLTFNWTSQNHNGFLNVIIIMSLAAFV